MGTSVGVKVGASVGVYERVDVGTSVTVGRGTGVDRLAVWTGRLGVATKVS